MLPAAVFSAPAKYKIGVAMKDVSDQFVKNIADAIKERAAQFSEIDLLMVDARGDINTQLSQVENFVTQKVSAIILNPMDAAGLGPAVDMAVKAKIPLVECTP
jgi:ABC-type sugar transport system substrate-binding protein